MTDRRTFITGLLASAVAPVADKPWSHLYQGPIPTPFITGPFRYMVVMSASPPQTIRWSEPQDFTNWDPT